MRNLIAIAVLIGAFGAGGMVEAIHDHAAIVTAQQNEMQAQGLEDEAKATMWGVLTKLPNGGFKLEHVPMPSCPDGLKRTVDIPERDEVDALTVNCGVSQ